MRGFRILTGLLLAVLPCAGQRAAINDKRAPESLEDLREIQRLVQAAMPAARAATVCIKLEDGFGSGVIVSKDGLIMTAAHVTGGTDTEFTVVFEDGREVKAKSLGLNSDTDAALARIVEEGEYPFVEVDREDSVQLGDWVFALGHSGGFDKDRGVVARVGRIVRTASRTMQSDCNLIGGDSGGPLFDLNGKLVGIHSRVGDKLPENLHVPSAEFLKNWEKMMSGEFMGEGPFAQKPELGKGYLGILVEGREGGGVVVKRVGSEGPAKEAGLKVGDVILKADDKALSSREDLQGILAEKAPGNRIALEIEREGETEILTIKLAHRDE
jgi:serine protease Do